MERQCGAQQWCSIHYSKGRSTLLGYVYGYGGRQCSKPITDAELDTKIVLVAVCPVAFVVCGKYYWLFFRSLHLQTCRTIWLWRGAHRFPEFQLTYPIGRRIPCHCPTSRTPLLSMWIMQRVRGSDSFGLLVCLTHERNVCNSPPTQ